MCLHLFKSRRCNWKHILSQRWLTKLIKYSRSRQWPENDFKLINSSLLVFLLHPWPSTTTHTPWLSQSQARSKIIFRGFKISIVCFWRFAQFNFELLFFCRACRFVSKDVFMKTSQTCLSWTNRRWQELPRKCSPWLRPKELLLHFPGLPQNPFF